LAAAPKVEVVPPAATVTVTAAAAVDCPLSSGETVTLTFEGTEVLWTKETDGTTTPTVTGTGTLSSTAALSPGGTVTLTAASGNHFHFFAGSVGGAAGASGGAASGDPFLRPML
jgi:hypothetical protein